MKNLRYLGFSYAQSHRDKPSTLLFNSFVNYLTKDELIKEKVSKLRSLIYSGSDRDTIQKYKSDNLPFITPSGIFNEDFKDNSVKTHTGIIVLDFDKLENVHEVHEKIKACKYTMCSFISPSGNGIKVFIYTGCSVDTHLEAFEKCTHYYSQFASIDEGGSNVGRKCYFSHDTNFYINDNSEVFEFAKMETPPKKASKIALGANASLSMLNGIKCNTESVGALFNDLNNKLEKGFVVGNRQTFYTQFVGKAFVSGFSYDDVLSYTLYGLSNREDSLPSKDMVVALNHLWNKNLLEQGNKEYLKKFNDIIDTKLTIKNRVQEVEIQLYQILCKGADFFIKAPTGSGKTYSIKNIGENAIKEGYVKKVVLVLPLILLVKQEEGGEWLGIHNEIKNKKEVANTSHVLTTIQQLSMIDLTDALVVMDEAHWLASGVVTSELDSLKFHLARAKQRVFISATPPPYMASIFKTNIVEITRENNPETNIKIISSAKKGVLMREIRDSIIEDKGITAVFINSSKAIAEIIKYVTDNEYLNESEIGVIVANDKLAKLQIKHLDITKDIQYNELIPAGKKLVIMTSACEFGVNIKNTNINKFIYGKSVSISPTSIAQSMARFRNWDKPNVVIIAGNTEKGSNTDFKTVIGNVLNLVNNTVDYINQEYKDFTHYSGVVPHHTIGFNASKFVNIYKDETFVKELKVYVEARERYLSRINTEKLVEELVSYIPNCKVTIEYNENSVVYDKIDSKESYQKILDFVTEKDTERRCQLLYTMNEYYFEKVASSKDNFYVQGGIIPVDLSEVAMEIMPVAAQCNFEQIIFNFKRLRMAKVTENDAREALIKCGDSQLKFNIFLQKIFFALKLFFDVVTKKNFKNKLVNSAWEMLIPTHTKLASVINKEMSFEELYESLYTKKNRPNKDTFKKFLNSCLDFTSREVKITKDGKRVSQDRYTIKGLKTAHDILYENLKDADLTIQILMSDNEVKIHESDVYSAIEGLLGNDAD